MPHMRNESGAVILVNEQQMAAFAAQGYKRCESPRPPAPSGPVVEESRPAGVALYRGDEQCLADDRQVAAMVRDGWSEDPEPEPKDPEPELKTVVVNVQDPEEIAKALDTPEAEQVILNIISKNSGVVTGTVEEGEDVVIPITVEPPDPDKDPSGIGSAGCVYPEPDPDDELFDPDDLGSGSLEPKE